MEAELIRHELQLYALRSDMSDQVPLLSYWMHRNGEIWKVVKKTDDGQCVIKRSGKERYKHGPIRSLVLSYQRI